MSPSVIVVSVVGMFLLRHVGPLLDSTSHGRGHGGFRFGGFRFGVGTSSLACLFAVGFFAWQFGTKKGQSAFKWSNIVDRMKDLSVWEAIQFASLMEGALRALNQINHARK